MSYSTPGLTASLQLTQHLRKLAPPRYPSVLCFIFPRHPRIAAPQMAVGTLCGACTPSANLQSIPTEHKPSPL